MIVFYTMAQYMNVVFCKFVIIFFYLSGEQLEPSLDADLAREVSPKMLPPTSGSQSPYWSHP